MVSLSFCYSEVTAPSSRGVVQKFLMVSLFCCSEGTAPSSRGKVQVQNILMRSCCRREGNGSVVTCNGSEDPDGVVCRNVVWCTRVCFNFNAELVLSGAGRFFLKLLVGGNLLLSYGMAHFDRDGEFVLKRFIQVQHSSTGILWSFPIGVELPYLIYSQVALQCLECCTFSVFSLRFCLCFSGWFPVLASSNVCYGAICR